MIWDRCHQPIYKHWFPQNTVNGSVPGLGGRGTYFSHKFGSKLHIISLDTEYLDKMEGRQTAWLEETLANSDAEIKIVQYHGPIYAAWDPEDKEDYLVIDEGKEKWLPLFDRYNVTVASENHSHGFKRSKRIKYGHEHPKGTIYLGEGNWGARIPPIGCVPIHEEFIEKVSIDNNVWLLEIDNTNILRATAYNEKGDLLDEIDITI